LKKVHVTSILPILQSGHRFIINTPFSQILIRNLEKPIEKGDLLASNQVITKHIGQHIMPSRGADNASLLQLKPSPMLYSNFISTWVAFVLLYSVYTWSNTRHRCCNYFGFKDIKPRIKDIVETDASIVFYPKTSVKNLQKECIAECVDVKSELFICLALRPFSQQDRLNRKSTPLI
jgi:hypothetical protein